MTSDRLHVGAPDRRPPQRPLRRSPRRNALRRSAIRLHRWTGFALLLWFVFEAVSGSYLAVADDAERWLHPSWYASGSTDLGPSRAVAAAQAAVPEGSATSLVFPHEAYGIYQVYVSDARSVTYEVNVNPSTGLVTHKSRVGEGFEALVLRLHANLNTSTILGMDSGEFVGWLGLFWLANMALGFAVVRRRRAAMRPSSVTRARGNRYRFQLALHRTLGMLVLVPATVAVLTGLVFAFPSQAGTVFDAALPGSVNSAGTAPPVSTPSADGNRATLDEIAASVRTHGGGPIKDITVPTGNPLGSVEVVTDGGGYSPGEGVLGTPGRDVTVYVDQYSAAVLAVDDGEKSVAAEVATDYNVGIHFGLFAGWFSKILWILVGLATVFLGTSAVLMRSGRWPWQRGRARRLAERRFRKAEAEADILRVDESADLVPIDEAADAAPIDEAADLAQANPPPTS